MAKKTVSKESAKSNYPIIKKNTPVKETAKKQKMAVDPPKPKKAIASAKKQVVKTKPKVKIGKNSYAKSPKKLPKPVLAPESLSSNAPNITTAKENPFIAPANPIEYSLVPASTQPKVNANTEPVISPVNPAVEVAQGLPSTFPADYIFKITELDVSPPYSICSFNNGSIKAGINHWFQRTGDLMFKQEGFYGDGKTPLSKDIPFPDKMSCDMFFNDLIALEQKRGEKISVKQSVVGKIIKLEEVDLLISALQPAPPAEAKSVQAFDPKLLPQQNNQNYNNGMQNGGALVPEKKFTDEDFKKQMQEYGKTIYEAVCDSFPARCQGGMPVTQFRAEILNSSLKQYRYELLNTGGGYYIEMYHNSDMIRIPEAITEFLPVI